MRRWTKCSGIAHADKSGVLAAALALLALCGCVPVGPDFVPPDSMLPSVSFLGKSEPAIAGVTLAPSDLSGVDPKWLSLIHI